MNAEQRQTAADLWTKLADFSHCVQLSIASGMSVCLSVCDSVVYNTL